jgi:hypothetical protein
MAYAKASSSAGANPPLLIGDQPIAGPRNWFYVSSHTRAVVAASTHFTDAKVLGAKIGDQIDVFETGASNSASDTDRVSRHMFTEVQSTYATLSVGILTSSAS